MSASPSSSPKSPKVAPVSPSPKKRAADGDSSNSADAAQSSSKKQKAAASDEYQLNFNRALDKEHEGKTFAEIIKLPPSALQGLSGKADKMLEAFRINTIEDLVC